MTAIYNEIDPFAAQWIRNLIAAGHVAPGEVNETSIKELTPAVVAGEGQRHFFAGIAVWSAALRAAGFSDSASVWSGSCPCQPFSGARQKGRGGITDPRHLWPDFFRLIEAGRPLLVVGEQVASLDGLAWLDAVSSDLAGAGYSFRALDLCAAGFGAPHIRQRLYWCAFDMADPSVAGRLARRGPGEASDGRDQARIEPRRLRHVGGLGNSDGEHARRDSGSSPRAKGRARVRTVGDMSRAPGPIGWVGDSDDARSQRLSGDGPHLEEPRRIDPGEERSRPTSGLWGACDWVDCRDGKRRPIEPGTFPLADGVTGRVGRLRAYGNAVTLGQAAGFLEAVRGSLEDAGLFDHFR